MAMYNVSAIIGLQMAVIRPAHTVMDQASVATSSSGIGDLSLDGLDISSADHSNTSGTSSCIETTGDYSTAVSMKEDGTAKTFSSPKAKSVELESPSSLEVQR